MKKIIENNKNNENQKVENEIEKVKTNELKKVDESIIEIQPEVVATIVNVEVDKNELVKKSLNWIDAFGSKNTKGIKIDITKNDIKIEISIITKYGYRIPDIAYDLQNAIKKEVENMTGIKVSEVNIHVQGIFTDEEGSN